MTKILNGSPQPGQPGFGLPQNERGTPLVSATGNANDRQAESKPYEPGTINGSPQPGQPGFGGPNYTGQKLAGGGGANG